MSGSIVLIVTGLKAEARIAAGEGCYVVPGGGDGAGLARRLDSLRGEDFTAVVSFGVAGALDRASAVGDIILATAVQVESRTYPADSALLATWAARLSGDTGLRLGAIAGVDQAAATADAKAALAAATNAVAVDMESHVAAEFAAEHGLPLGAVRVISDGAGRTLPPLAAAAMRADGSVDLPGLLRGLARDPRQIPGLVATARDAAIAFRALRRVRRLLGPGFGLHL